VSRKGVINDATREEAILEENGWQKKSQVEKRWEKLSKKRD